MMHSDDKLKTYFKMNWINNSWRKNFDEQKRLKWFKFKLLFFDIYKHQLFDNHEHQTSQMIVSEEIQRRKRFASNINDSLTKISRIEEIINENASIFRQQSSTSIVQKEYSKNFINTDDKKNENSLTRLKSFELRSRFIQTLTRTRITCEMQNRHFNIQFKSFSFNLLTFVALIAQTVKKKEFYKLKTYAETMTDNYHKIN